MMRTRLFAYTTLTLIATSCAVDSVPEGDPPPSTLTPTTASPDAPPPSASFACTPGNPATVVGTIVGCEQSGAQDGAVATARLYNPVNVVPVAGGLMVADFSNGLIRKVALDGSITTVVKQANFRVPFGLAAAPDGTLYIETDDNPKLEHSLLTGTIWKLAPGATTAEPLLTDAGRPRGLLVLPDGNLLAADHMHHVVSHIDVATRRMTIIAGQYNRAGNANGMGDGATLTEPYHLARLPTGDIVVSELTGYRIRKLQINGAAPAIVTTFAGTGQAGTTDGPVASASFAGPQGLAAGPDGSVYVSDLGGYTIRKIQNGQVTTIAGSNQGFADSDTPRSAKFYGLESISLAPDGKTLYVSDGTRGFDDKPYHRIRTIRLDRL